VIMRQPGDTVNAHSSRLRAETSSLLAFCVRAVSSAGRAPALHGSSTHPAGSWTSPRSSPSRPCRRTSASCTAPGSHAAQAASRWLFETRPVAPCHDRVTSVSREAEKREGIERRHLARSSQIEEPGVAQGNARSTSQASAQEACFRPLPDVAWSGEPAHCFQSLLRAAKQSNQYSACTDCAEGAAGFVACRPCLV
jgi:hypothetical protein